MADVSPNIHEWSTTRSSNAPSGSAVAGAGIDDNLREIQGTVRGAFAYIGANIIATSTMDVGGSEGSTHIVTGSATITSLGTVSAGIRKRLIFSASCTLTHNGTSLICPGSANLALANGDVVDVESLGGGNWKVAHVTKQSGQPAVATQASGVTSSAVRRVTATNVNTAIDQLERLASPAFGFLSSVSGTNAITASADALLASALVNGEVVRFIPVANNTTGVTLNVNGTGAREVRKAGPQFLVANDLVGGMVHYLVYDGTYYQLLNPGVPYLQGMVSTGAGTFAGAISAGAGITAGGDVTLPHLSALRSRDSANVSRQLMYMGAADVAFVEGGTGGLTLRTNNGSTTALQVSASGKINSGALASSTTEMANRVANTFATPSTMEWHPGVAKAWVVFNGAAGTITGSYGVASLTKNGTGDYTINWSTSFAGNYVPTIAVYNDESVGGATNFTATIVTVGVSSLRIRTGVPSLAVLADSIYIAVAAFGLR